MKGARAGCILAIDQSTAGTKALLLDADGQVLARADAAHRQLVSEEGWISHDPEEIWQATLRAAAEALAQAGFDGSEILAIGISNQRETSLIWDRQTGKAVDHAVVWQCARAQPLVQRLAAHSELVQLRSGLILSPYFPAAKWAHLIEENDLDPERIRCGTIDSWLLHRMTGGEVFATDLSNASRSALMNLDTLNWDPDLCELFAVPLGALPEISMSDAMFGMTDLDGLLPNKVAIRGVLGDSHAALFGQRCWQVGMAKATYGTGSSIMMQVGETRPQTADGIVASVAWGREKKVHYCLEGNINYAGAVMTWVVEELGLLESAKDAARVAALAHPEDMTCLVPAFSGLGAPWWRSDVRASITGMTRFTGRAELVAAAEDAIAEQVVDIVEAMQDLLGQALRELRVDGGPTRDAYLMQLQADLLQLPVAVAAQEELSAIGAGVMAGLAVGFYEEEAQPNVGHRYFDVAQSEAWRDTRRARWRAAIVRSLA